MGMSGKNTKTQVDPKKEAQVLEKTIRKNMEKGKEKMYVLKEMDIDGVKVKIGVASVRSVNSGRMFPALVFRIVDGDNVFDVTLNMRNAYYVIRSVRDLEQLYIDIIMELCRRFRGVRRTRVKEEEYVIAEEEEEEGDENE